MRKTLFISLCFLLVTTLCFSDVIDGKKYDDFEVTDWGGMGAPSVSPTNQGRIYYDSTSDTLKLSLDGGAFADIITATTGGGLYLKLDCSNDPLTNTLDGANLDFTGHAALGADASVSAVTILDIDETLTTQDTTQYGILTQLDLVPAGALSVATHLVAMDMQAHWKGAVDGSTHAVVQGIKGEGINQSATHDVYGITGVYGKAVSLEQTDVAVATGVDGFVSNDDDAGEGGDMTTAYSFLARAHTNKGTGVIGTRYGLYVEDTTGGGLLTNQVGIYLEDLDAASTFGAYIQISDKYIVCSEFTDEGINAAIDALGVEGGEVYLPEGTYTIDGQIDIDYNNTTLRGAGWGTKLDASGWSTDHVIDLNGHDWITIKDLWIDGNAGGGNAKDLIYYDSGGGDADHITLKNLKLTSSDHGAINLADSDWSKVIECYFQDNEYYSVYTSGSYYFTGNNNQSYSNDQAVFQIEGFYTVLNSNISWQDNRFCNVGSGGVAHATINGNIIFQPTTYGIYAYGGSHTTISSNNIYGAGYPAIYVRQNHCPISNNVINHSANNRDDIYVEGDYCPITGNDIISSAGYSERGIHLVNADFCLVEGNTSSGHDTCGIELDASSTNNHIVWNNLEGETTTIVDNGSNNAIAYFDSTSDDFEFNNDINIRDTDPHIALIPTVGDSFEIYAFGDEIYCTNLTTGEIIWRRRADGVVDFDDNDITTSGTLGLTGFTAGSVIFSDGTNLVEDNANFNFNDATNALTVGGTGTFGGASAGQSIIASGLVVNEDGLATAADDFRAETDTEVNAFVVDASADVVYSLVKFGVGTPIPDREIHVVGPTTWLRLDRELDAYGPAVLFVRKPTGGGAVQSSWLFGPTNTSGATNDNFAIIDYGTAVTGSTGDVRFLINKANGNIHIANDVGIGVSPLTALHIYKELAPPDDLGDFDNYQLVIGGHSDTGDTAGILLHTTINTYGGSAIVHYDTGGGGQGDLVFYTKQGTSAIPPVEVMRLDDAGNTLCSGKVAFTQVDLNEYIDSTGGDTMVYGATTGHRFIGPKVTVQGDLWIGNNAASNVAAVFDSNAGDGQITWYDATSKFGFNSTIQTTSGDDWDFNDYTADADHVAAGYVTVTINGTSYRLLAYLTP